MKSSQHVDSIRLSPVGISALIGAAVAFVLADAIVAMFWVVVGALIGAGIGWLIRRLGRDLHTLSDATELAESATKTELYEKAQELDVPGRSQMTREELAKEIAERG